jgi:prepilin-type processing-associated H-X9-DG protein
LGKLVIPALLCPSDRAQPGGTSFRGNFGISPFLFPPSRKTGSDNEERFVERGAFVNGQALLAAEFLDGLSQTAMFSERPIGDGNPGRYDPWRDRFSTETQVRSSSQVIETCRSLASPSPKDHDSYGGWNWLLGGIRHSWYDHLLTPNSDIPDCMLSFAAAGGGQGLATARSFHEGGVNVAMADGSARFISSSIDDAVWRALGTRNGSD